MDELLALRARVETLERDVAGLEAIVHNLDEKREDSPWRARWSGSLRTLPTTSGLCLAVVLQRTSL